MPVLSRKQGREMVNLPLQPAFKELPRTETTGRIEPGGGRDAHNVRFAGGTV
jgi:hypothetical protein